MALSSYRFRDQSTGCWGLPRIHSSDSVALAEGSRKPRQRHDPKAAIALPPGLPPHRRSGNRSETKGRSRYVFQSKQMPRGSKPPGSGTSPRRHGQTSRSWRASMRSERDHHPAENPPERVLPGVANRWHRIVAVEWRSGSGARRETMQDLHRREHQSKVPLSLGPLVSSLERDRFEQLKHDLHQRDPHWPYMGVNPGALSHFDKRK